MVVEFVASFAADALGMVEHPGAGRGDVNLPLAKQCIEALVTLRTRRRAPSPPKRSTLRPHLTQLRMQYRPDGQRAPRPAAPPRLHRRRHHGRKMKSCEP